MNQPGSGSGRAGQDFADVYDDEVWRVYAFIAYRVKVRADAEDLTQMTFEKALRAWGSFDPERASAATWLTAIARNVVIDHYRRDRTDRHEHDPEAMEMVPAPEDEARFGLDPDLEAALATLSERDREVIALRFGADLTGPEIAELLELTLANVQQILSRSLRKLRGLLEARASA